MRFKDKVALITDGRFSGGTRGFCIGHVGPEAAVGGPLALVRDGDMIAIDAERGTLDLEVGEAELSERRLERGRDGDAVKHGVDRDPLNRDTPKLLLLPRGRCARPQSNRFE